MAAKRGTPAEVAAKKAGGKRAATVKKKTGTKKAGKRDQKSAKKAAKRAAPPRTGASSTAPPKPSIPPEFSPQLVLMKPPRGGGRPTDYDPAIIDQVYRWFYMGYTVPMICRELCICKQTYYNWTRDHPEFLDCHNRGRMACQGYYEQAMRLAAIGAVSKYRHHAAKAIMHHHYGYAEPDEDDLNPDEQPLLVEFGEYVESEQIKETEAEVVQDGEG